MENCLEKIHAPLNTPCPYSITPEVRTNVDTEQLVCPECGKLGKKPRNVRRPFSGAKVRSGKNAHV